MDWLKWCLHWRMLEQNGSSITHKKLNDGSLLEDQVICQAKDRYFSTLLLFRHLTAVVNIRNLGETTSRIWFTWGRFGNTAAWTGRPPSHSHHYLPCCYGEHKYKFHITAHARQDRLGPHAIFTQFIAYIWGLYIIDLFATRLSRQLPQFCDWRPNPEVTATEAPTRIWHHLWYLPQCLIGKVLQKNVCLPSCSLEPIVIQFVLCGPGH